MFWNKGVATPPSSAPHQQWTAALLENSELPQQYLFPLSKGDVIFL